ncbi:MAG: hypothetical protein U9N61_02770 [Euryarchaeota archaeon]|nr:hypothetical protein [Euryarchaeota archaeon]
MKHLMFSKLRAIALILLYYGVCYIQPVESYNTFTGNIVCELQCLHEEGHKFDHEHGWISRTDEFKDRIDLYLWWQGEQEVKEDAYYVIMRETINVNLKFRRYEEIYAEVYRLEDKPEMLQEFYR